MSDINAIFSVLIRNQNSNVSVQRIRKEAGVSYEAVGKRVYDLRVKGWDIRTERKNFKGRKTTFYKLAA